MMSATGAVPRSAARRRRATARLGRLAAVVAASAALAVLPALPASAHNYVVATTPAKGAVVTAQPGTVSLETNEALLDVEGGSVIQVQGPDGRYYGDGCAVVDGPVATTQTQLGEPGEYTVTWRVVSTDGHPISGTWAFTWQPVDGIALADGSDEPGACGDTSAAAEPEASAPASESEAPDETSDAASAAPLDALWIVGGVLLAAVAAIVTWLVVRRRA
ncbi:copper resistance CopC family protein [Agromyces mariniharenae]|uniref:Copper resistance protein CopC n=1 Tax=Agromyces mariniharenae TaxID=2604423 RepID=A0A5S4V8B5_9MICO|nr:copper resistance CopC family protein [Agromyces mariniharenae]TYL54123.1 copper resistance protein CopC [Agromyces mariniharenae]